MNAKQPWQFGNSRLTIGWLHYEDIIFWRTASSLGIFV